MVSRSVKVTFLGDATSAEAATLKFANSLQNAEKISNKSAAAMTADFKNMEAAAKSAAAANERLAAIGSASGSKGGGILGDLLRQSGGGAGSNAGLGAVADSLDAGKISAGLAAASLGAAVAGAAVVKFGVDSVHAFTGAAKAVDDFQDKSGATAQQASVFVGAAQQLGVGADDLGRSVNFMLKSVDKNADALAKYGVAVARTKDGGVDAVATVQNIARAYAATADPAKRAELATLAFGRSGQNIIDILERGGPVLDSFFKSAADHAPMFKDEDLQKSVDFTQKITELSQEWEKFKVNAGKAIVPPATQTASGIERVGKDAGDAKGALDSFFGSIEEHAGPASGALSTVGSTVKGLATAAALGPIVGAGYLIGGLQPQANKAATGMKALHDATGLYYDRLPQATQGTDNMGFAFDRAGSKALSMADEIATASAAFQSLTGAHDNLAGDAISAATSQLEALNQKSTSASTAFADAQTQGAKQIVDAQKAVGDAMNGVADAQAGYAKAVEDANRTITSAEQDYNKAVADATQKVADVEEQSAKRIVDAQQKVTDARHRAAEAAVSSARRVEDATQALRDAETDALKETNPYDAQRKREDAGKQLTRAQEDAAQQQADSADTVTQAEHDLVDAQQQGSKDRAKAEQDAADQIAQAQQRIVDAHRQAADQIAGAQKQVQDAEDRVTDANGRLYQTSLDAQAAIEKASVQAATSAPSHDTLAKALQGVADNAFNTAYQMKLAGASDQDIQAFLATSTTTIDTYAQAWGFSAAEVQEYNRQVSLITRQVNVSYNLSLNATDFYNKIGAAAAAMHTTGEQLLADAGSLGITPVLGHDSGGWLPTGLSLSVNNTGRPERVLSPAEMDAGGGGGLTVIVQGAVISDRDLADIVAKAMRRGYKGFGN